LRVIRVIRIPNRQHILKVWRSHQIFLRNASPSIPTRSFARQSSHPSTRRPSLSLSLSRLARARLERLAPFAQTSRARATASSPAATSRWLFTRARVRFVIVSHLSLAHRSFVPSSLVPLTARRHRVTPPSRAFHAPLATPSASTSRDANVSIASTTPSPSSSSTIASSSILGVVNPRRAADADATRCVVDRVRSIDVDRCRSRLDRSMSIDVHQTRSTKSLDRSMSIQTRSMSIQTRSMSIQTRSIGLDQTSSDSIQTRSIGLDRTRSDSIDVDPDSIGLDRPRSDSIRQWWSSMSRDPRIPARGFPVAREWVRKPTHVVARARAVVPSSERDARGRDRQSDGVGASVRSCVRDRTSSASTVTRTKGKGTNEAVTEGIITSR